MNHSISWKKFLRSTLKLTFALGLSLCLIFSQGSDAWAARSGGRIGGGSFRAPTSRTYSAPRSYSSRSNSYQGGYRGGFGGFGFNPFFFIPFPLFGFGGGGGLLGLLVMLALASFVVRTVRQVLSSGNDGTGTSLPNNNPKVTVAKVQIGLSAQAKTLQADLGRLALSANTNTTTGLSQLLQESTLNLLRHPEYWVYGDVSSEQVRLTSAEAEFNRFVLEERSKFSGESLSNVKGEVQKKTSIDTAATSENGEPGEYIVVTLVVGSQNPIKLPKIQESDDLAKALRQVGSIASDQLLALEILWTPQVPGEVMSAEEVLAQYPNLTLV
ncbi:MAG: DUF1517 domain-containing protein [Prochlorothrix sp.]|nr:DUF1517 domain-containing protein [Prochlorothrix sp.]